MAYLVNDLGELYGTFGRLDRAGELLGEARDRWRALGNEAMLADSLTSSAVWEQIGGHFRAGLVKVEEAFLITTRIGNIWGEAYSQAVRGQILGWLGELGRAVEDLLPWQREDPRRRLRRRGHAVQYVSWPACCRKRAIWTGRCGGRGRHWLWRASNCRNSPGMCIGRIWRQSS